MNNDFTLPGKQDQAMRLFEAGPQYWNDREEFKAAILAA